MTDWNTRTFEPFMRLPLELRIQIWSQAAFPRLVDVKAVRKGPMYVAPRGELMHSNGAIYHIASSRPAPAVMQVCQESRQHAPYKKAFTKGCEPRYTWINFEKDMIEVDSHEALHDAVKDHIPDIQRLRLGAGTAKEGSWIQRHTGRELREYPELREFQLLDTYCPRDWSAYETCFLSSGHEASHIIMPKSGLMLTLPQLDMIHSFHEYHAFDESGGSKVAPADDEDESSELDIFDRLLSELHEIG